MQLIDKQFVPGLNDPVIARANRIGQDTSKPVEVFQYFSTGTAEARVQQILDQKEHVVGQVVKTTAELEEIMIQVLQEQGVSFAA